MYPQVMLKRIPATLCLFLAVGLATAQSDPKDKVFQAEAAFNLAKLHNDIAALDAMVADDFIGINQVGERRDKQALLHTRFAITSLTSSRVTVRVNGDTATIDGVMNQNHVHTFLFLRTYVKRNDRWLLLSTFQGFPVDTNTMKVIDPGGSQATHPITGRPYAGMMSAAGADWLVRLEREKRKSPTRPSRRCRLPRDRRLPISAPASVT